MARRPAALPPPARSLSVTPRSSRKPAAFAASAIPARSTAKACCQSNTDTKHRWSLVAGSGRSFFPGPKNVAANSHALSHWAHSAWMEEPACRRFQMMSRPQAGSYEKPLFAPPWKAHGNQQLKNAKNLPDPIPDKLQFPSNPLPRIGFWPWPKETAGILRRNVLRMLFFRSRLPALPSSRTRPRIPG